MRWRRYLVWLAACILAAEAVNLSLATTYITNTRFPFGSSEAQRLKGAEAAAIPWKERIPESYPSWPAADSVSILRAFGHARYNMNARDPANPRDGLSMQADQYGWPFPCLSEAGRWWPWSAPKWTTTERPEVRLHPLWGGLLLNAVICGAPAWLLIMTAVLITKGFLRIFRTAPPSPPPQRRKAVPQRYLMTILLMVLVGAAISPLLAILYIPTKPSSRHGMVANGPEAASFPWPERAPAAHSPWPAPSSYNRFRNLGHTYINIISDFGRDKGGNGFQMETHLYGFPLPCLSESNRWWSWKDPAWKTDEQPEVPLHLVWTGVLLDPLLIGLSLWLLVFGLPTALVSARTHRRLKRGLCTKCAYPVVPSGTCPECGHNNAVPQPQPA